MSGPNYPLEPHATDALLATLRTRFEAHMDRHPSLSWDAIESRIRSRAELARTLARMEETGGEPDVIGYDTVGDHYLYVDCSTQSPSGRRNLCYDEPARIGRQKFPPESSALEMAADMGVELLDEPGYRNLQSVGAFDTTTSSWIVTPERIRVHGGAIFGDRRYGAVFIYHNGADSYYAARGFRGLLRV